MRRIPTLDGWRGVAIILVLADHFQEGLMGKYLASSTQTGQHGVNIFFVLSGFLITSKLLEGPRSLKSFYLRRFFRLMPAAWLYLLAIWAFSLIPNHKIISGSEILSCVFSYRNFTGSQLTLAAAHFWSLSVEEQFYVIWPCVLVFLGEKKAAWLVAFAALSFALYRAAHWDYFDRGWYCFYTEARADGLLVGCLLSLLLHKPRIGKFLRTCSQWLRWPAITAVLYAILAFHWLTPLFESVGIAILITASVSRPDSRMSTYLSSKPLVWLGTLSYSIYIWQQLFLLIWPPSVSQITVFLLPIFAIASFYCIERPSTRFGHRLTQATSNA